MKTVSPEGVHRNMTYSLSIFNGYYADSGSVSTEEPEEIQLGSEIEAVQIGEFTKGDFENGTGIEKKWFIIVQRGQALLVETIKTSFNYGCSYMKNGGSEEYSIFSLEPMRNVVISVK